MINIVSKRKKILLLLLFSIIFILFFTLIFRETMVLRRPNNRGLSLKPFSEVYLMFHETNHLFYFWQILLNIILFWPLGFLLTAYLYLYHKRIRFIWFIIFLFGFVLSISIEVLQYITSRGYSEVDDLINNTLGSLIGYWGYKTILKKIKKATE